VKFNVNLDLSIVVEVEYLLQEYKDVFDGPQGFQRNTISLYSTLD
jgi:hypothetical protein